MTLVRMIETGDQLTGNKRRSFPHKRLLGWESDKTVALATLDSASIERDIANELVLCEGLAGDGRLIDGTE